MISFHFQSLLSTLFESNAVSGAVAVFRRWRCGRWPAKTVVGARSKASQCQKTARNLENGVEPCEDASNLSSYYYYICANIYMSVIAS